MSNSVTSEFGNDISPNNSSRLNLFEKIFTKVGVLPPDFDVEELEESFEKSKKRLLRLLNFANDVSSDQSEANPVNSGEIRSISESNVTGTL